MNLLDQIGPGSLVLGEFRLARETNDEASAGSQVQFLDSRRCPLTCQEAGKGDGELAVSLDLPQLVGEALADLFGFTDGKFDHGGGHWDGGRL